MLRGFPASVHFVELQREISALSDVAFACDAQTRELMCRLCKPLLEQPFAAAGQRQVARIAEPLAGRPIAIWVWCPSGRTSRKSA